MPIPKRKPNEDRNAFIGRCMSNETMKKEYPDNKQRVAICLGQTKGSLLEQVCDIIDYDPDVEQVTALNLYIPKEDEYEDFGEETEEFSVTFAGKYVYMDPITQEYFYFD